MARRDDREYPSNAARLHHGPFSSFDIRMKWHGLVSSGSPNGSVPRSTKRERAIKRRQLRSPVHDADVDRAAAERGGVAFRGRHHLRPRPRFCCDGLTPAVPRDRRSPRCSDTCMTPATRLAVHDKNVPCRGTA